MTTSRPTDRRTVVLTGASSGIGRATAMALARQGDRLVLASRGGEALEQTLQSCLALGAEAIAVPTDVTDGEAVERLGAEARQRFGQFDVWINMVGLGAVGDFDETPMAAHRRVIECNLIGHFNGSHVALRHFKELGRGTLVQMNSVGAWSAIPYAASYTASKFGLRGMSESLRAELTAWPGIHVCDVFPAFVDTPGIAHAANYTGHQLKPAPPLSSPESVANAIVSLLARPRPSVTVGWMTPVLRTASTLAPQFSGWAARRLMDAYFAQAPAAQRTHGALYQPSAAPHGPTGAWRSSPTGGGDLTVIAGVLGAAALAIWAAGALRR